MLRLMVRILPIFGKDPRRWGRNGDIDLASLAFEEFPTHASIDFTAVIDRRAEASICHASQGGSAMIRGLMGWATRLMGRKETFMALTHRPSRLRKGPVCRYYGSGLLKEQPLLFT
jgi:hypothetical protein